MGIPEEDPSGACQGMICCKKIRYAVSRPSGAFQQQAALIQHNGFCNSENPKDELLY